MIVDSHENQLKRHLRTDLAADGVLFISFEDRRSPCNVLTIFGAINPVGLLT